MVKELTPIDAYNLLHQGTLALADVEANGIRIDTDYLERAGKKLDKQIVKLEQRLKDDPIFKTTWKQRYGIKTNLGSRTQLSEIVFNHLNIESKGTTKSGRNKADKDAFADVDLPFVKDYLRLERFKKTNTTYLGNVRQETIDGFLHCMFDLNTVATYRSSSSFLNFQNLPIRDPEQGEPIRRCFIPREGHVLVEVDYSGIEVKIAACYHQDPVMLEYIRDPTKDMHRDMAAECFLIKPEEVSKQSRYVAKNLFVFPQFYGDYYIHCAKNMWDAMGRMKLALPDGTSIKEHLASKGIKKVGRCDPKHPPEKGTFESHIKEVEHDFWKRRFKVYDQWKRDWIEAYQRNGTFRMLTGFDVSGYLRKNEIINYPVQGSAFHCLLWSLIKTNSWLKKNKMRSVIVGQIHDSILGDVHLSELQAYLTKIKEIMTVRLPKAWPWIVVPLEVEVEVTPEGGSWYEKELWECGYNGIWGVKSKDKK